LDNRSAGTTNTEETHRMLGLHHGVAEAFWRVVDMPIRWINGGPIDPDIERLQEFLELAILVIVTSVGILIVWDLIRHSLRQATPESQRRR
jgi:hypothetical protein